MTVSSLYPDISNRKIKTNGREHHHQRHLFIGRLRAHGPNETAIEIMPTIQNCKNYIEYICSVEKYVIPEKKDRIACEIATCSLHIFIRERSMWLQRYL